jgi:hypothetical protein
MAQYVNIEQIESDMQTPSNARLMKFVGATLNFIITMLIWLLGVKKEDKDDKKEVKR